MTGASELHSMLAMGTSMVAMSKYGKTVDNSSSNNSSSDNSTSNNDSESSSTGGDSSMTNSNNSSNLENASQNSSNQDNSSNGNSNMDSSSNSPTTETSTPDFTNDSFDIGSTTSLADRIDAYKELTGSNFSFDNSSVIYKTNDWGNVDVSDTKEHKS